MSKLLVVSLALPFLINCNCRAADKDCSQDPGLLIASTATPALNVVFCKALDDVFRDFAGSCSITFPINLTKNSDLDKKPGKKRQLFPVSAVPKLLLTAVQRTN